MGSGTITHMETPITATVHTARHDDTGDVWTIDLYTHGPDGAELFATVGTSEDDADSDDPADWVAAWAERVGYDTYWLDIAPDHATLRLTPAPPARWTIETIDSEGRMTLLSTERYDGPPIGALDLAVSELIGEPDGEYRVTTYSAEFELMDRAEVEVHSYGAKVAQV